MKTVLHLDASARKVDKQAVREKADSIASKHSISKTLAAVFIEHWLAKNQQGKVINRDIGINPPSFINEEWISAVFTPEAELSPEQHLLLAESNVLYDELNQADIIVLSTPMYNYGMPASLKAWFDQIIRVNKTFSFDLGRGDFPLQPIMSGKTLVLITSSGEFGFGPGGVREDMDHLTSHIQVLSKYLGVETICEVHSEFQEFADERHQKSVSAALRRVKGLAQKV